MPLNLHDIVRGAINIVNPDEDVWLIQNIGQTNVKGRITAVYAEPERCAPRCRRSLAMT